MTGATAVATTPYGGSSSEIQVIVSKTAPSFFGKVLGVNSANVSATAVAGLKAGVTSCSNPGLRLLRDVREGHQLHGHHPILLGGGTHVNGGMTSNGSINVGGGGSNFGNTTYGNGSGCTVGPSGYQQQSNTFTSGPTAATPLATWPVNYATDFPACVGAACTGPRERRASALSRPPQRRKPCRITRRQICCPATSTATSVPARPPPPRPGTARSQSKMGAWSRPHSSPER